MTVADYKARLRLINGEPPELAPVAKPAKRKFQLSKSQKIALAVSAPLWIPLAPVIGLAIASTVGIKAIYDRVH